MKYEDVEYAIQLRRGIDELDDLKHDINSIISTTELLDNRDFDSVFRKMQILRDNRMKELEDL